MHVCEFASNRQQFCRQPAGSLHIHGPVSQTSMESSSHSLFAGSLLLDFMLLSAGAVVNGCV